MFSSRRTRGRPEVWSCCNLAALKVNRTYRTLDVFQLQAEILFVEKESVRLSWTILSEEEAEDSGPEPH